MKSNKAALRRCCKFYRPNMIGLPFSKHELESAATLQLSIQPILTIFVARHPHEQEHIFEGDALELATAYLSRQKKA